MYPSEDLLVAPVASYEDADEQGNHLRDPTRDRPVKLVLDFPFQVRNIPVRGVSRPVHPYIRLADGRPNFGRPAEGADEWMKRRGGRETSRSMDKWDNEGSMNQ